MVCFFMQRVLSKIINMYYRRYWRDVREFSRQYQVRHGIAMLAVVIESGAVYLALLVGGHTYSCNQPSNKHVAVLVRHCCHIRGRAVLGIGISLLLCDSAHCTHLYRGCLNILIQPHIGDVSGLSGRTGGYSTLCTRAQHRHEDSNIFQRTFCH